MQGIQNQDIVGVKRQLPLNYDNSNFHDLSKKIKIEDPIKIPEPFFLKNLMKPEIPTLNNDSSPNLDLLKSALLVGQANLAQRYLMQQYLKLLTLNHLVQQQGSLLNVKRENSASSINSQSTSQSSSQTLSPVKAPSQQAFSPIKAPIIITKPEPSLLNEIPKFEDFNSQKKCLKVSACKNYIALLCTGFARSILTAESGSDMMTYLQDNIIQKKAKYPSLNDKGDQELQAFILDHIYKDICGKKVKKMNKGRDFKVRNTEELEVLLTPKEGDSDLIKFRKEMLKDLISYFFVSRHYSDWLEKGMINEANRNFFLKNKVEIQKKFANPALYKPHFDYNSN